MRFIDGQHSPSPFAWSASARSTSLFAALATGCSHAQFSASILIVLASSLGGSAAPGNPVFGHGRGSHSFQGITRNTFLTSRSRNISRARAPF
jgi:hypothetical protein